VNRYLGDIRAILKHLSMKTAGSASFSVLDIATGSADIPLEIAVWARKAVMRADITVVDINPRIIEIARKRCEGFPEIKVAVADGLDLSFPDKNFDFVLCSKTAHHFSDEEVVRLIGGMLRIAKRGYIIMDLRRSWIACALIYILTRLFTRNRLTRYDGPLSVLRSFTPGELAALARRAGATDFAISGEPFWLTVLEGEVT
jgi:ubiquinone/menaquinone biosynthesis C-methylase UbiE